MKYSCQSSTPSRVMAFIELYCSFTLIPECFYLQKMQVPDKQKFASTWLCQKITYVSATKKHKITLR